MNRYLLILAMTIVLSGLSGCAVIRKPASAVAQGWGNSYVTARDAQILKPDAGKDLRPVTGFDGEAAARTIKAYRKTFEKKPPKTVYSINLSDIGGK